LPWMGKFIGMFLGLKLVQEKMPEAIAQKLTGLACDFEIGTKSLTNLITWPLIAAQTLAIWVCYWLALYIAVFAFNLQSQISAVKSLMIFALSSVSVLIPTPGSVGTYHAAVKQGLVSLAGLDPNLAVAFASVVHLFSFILVPCITAAICIGIQSSSAAKTGSQKTQPE